MSNAFPNGYLGSAHGAAAIMPSDTIDLTMPIRAAPTGITATGLTGWV